MSSRARRPTQSQQRPPFSHQASSNFTSMSTTTGLSTATRLPAMTTEQAQPQSSPYKALQHKHAHHLHSIPPREKSTRTLIIDHMLWIHTRARVQQARAELGMKVSVKDVKKPDVPDGHSGFNFSYNNETEGDEANSASSSDYEDLLTVKFGAKDRERDMRSEAEDEHQAAQDLTMAHALRLHADGLEKVLTAMLDQPPETQPAYPDEDAPRIPMALYGVGEHRFPNGVRLRLALATLVNDLFSRDVPTAIPLSAEQTPSGVYKSYDGPIIPKTSALPAPAMSSNSSNSGDSPGGSLPPALGYLSKISGYNCGSSRGRSTTLPSFSALTSGARTGNSGMILPPIRDPNTQGGTDGYHSRSNSESHLQDNKQRPRKAIGRVLQLYNAGADPHTANSHPTLRCPRHLHHSCVICAAAKPPSFPPTTSSSSRSRGAIVLSSNGSKAKILSKPSNSVLSWKFGCGIGSGLARPGVNGSVLRRRTLEQYHAASTVREMRTYSSGGKVAELIPRFLVLSALVATELGREAKDRELEQLNASKGQGQRDTGPNESNAMDIDTSETEDMDQPDHLSQSPLLLSYIPTREWYAILVGLLTRAILGGYVSRAWKGPLALECLMRVGIGLDSTKLASFEKGKDRGGEKDKVKDRDWDDEGDEYAHLNPDALPTLEGAVKVIFPTLRAWDYQTRESNAQAFSAQKAYEEEMMERLAEFLSVPESTPDLSTHLEDLAYKFPTEPIERVAVRFCEAVARWRGKPELEANRRPQQDGTSNQISVPGQSSTNTTPKKTSIDRYFVPPPVPVPKSDRRDSRSKRARSPDGHGNGSTKYRKVNDGDGSSDPVDPSASGGDWTGPYGL